jgi:hypothetical protein
LSRTKKIDFRREYFFWAIGPLFLAPRTKKYVAGLNKHDIGQPHTILNNLNPTNR